eukprot:symbB.v1.2.016587.t1/scaffold1253.1/size128728/14
MPGMVLSVPVKNGSEKVQIRVPENCGVGSALALVQPEGSDEWDLQVLEAVIPEDSSWKMLLRNSGNPGIPSHSSTSRPPMETEVEES